MHSETETVKYCFTSTDCLLAAKKANKSPCPTNLPQKVSSTFAPYIVVSRTQSQEKIESKNFVSLKKDVR